MLGLTLCVVAVADLLVDLTSLDTEEIELFGSIDELSFLAKEEYFSTTTRDNTPDTRKDCCFEYANACRYCVRKPSHSGVHISGWLNDNTSDKMIVWHTGEKRREY